MPITNRLRALLVPALAGDAALAAAFAEFAAVAADVENPSGPYHHLMGRLRRLRHAALDLLGSVPDDCEAARMLLEGICLAGAL